MKLFTKKAENLENIAKYITFKDSNLENAALQYMEIHIKSEGKAKKPIPMGYSFKESGFGYLVNLQGAPIKNNSLGKIHYLSYCKRFFHQIYSFYRGGFAPHTQHISSQYLLWFKNYNHLN